MNETQGTSIIIVGIENDVTDLARRLEEEAVATRRVSPPAMDSALAFGVESLTALIATLGSSGLIAAATKCLLTFLRERKKRIQIIDGPEKTEITAENFDERELSAILGRLRAGSKIIISRASQK
jgi:hypothetical protein